MCVCYLPSKLIYPVYIKVYGISFRNWTLDVDGKQKSCERDTKETE